MNLQIYRMLFQEMQEGFALHEIICDDTGQPVDYRFLDVNPAFEELTGLPYQDVVGRTVLDVLPETEFLCKELFDKVALTGQSAQFGRFAPALGKYYQMSTFQPAPGQLACVFSDISKRVQTEQALRESEEKYRTLAENSVDRIWQTDMHLVFTYINPTRTPELVYTPEEVIGRPMSDFVPHEEFQRIKLLLAQEMASGPNPRGVRVEATTLTKTGAQEYVEVCAVLLFDAQGNAIGIQGLTRDITERLQAEQENKKLQEQLQHAQKMESVGRLAGGVAHDFNNMLGAILGYTELALEQIPPEEPVYNYLQEVLHAAERSADITQQLLAFARKQTIVPRVLCLNETVERMFKMLRRLLGENINLEWTPAQDLPPIRVDPAQIHQILANLCVNARDAIGDIGEIIIETAQAHLDAAAVADQEDVQPGNFVSVAVTDTGSGMDSNTMAHIFEPFFTTKEVGKGTGLGLATVYGAVKQNKGLITVDSTPGQGTKITVYFPKHITTGKEEEVARSVANIKCRGETLLLVEDDSRVLKMAHLILQKQGYIVLPAARPSEAISLAQQHKGSIDLLITDIIMPEMNGRQLAATLVARYPKLNCLFMSGYTADVIADNGLLDEDIHFIEKPFSHRDLAAMVRRVLDEGDRGQDVS